MTEKPPGLVKTGVNGGEESDSTEERDEEESGDGAGMFAGVVVVEDTIVGCPGDFADVDVVVVVVVAVPVTEGVVVDGWRGGVVKFMGDLNFLLWDERDGILTVGGNEPEPEENGERLVVDTGDGGGVAGSVERLGYTGGSGQGLSVMSLSTSTIEGRRSESPVMHLLIKSARGHNGSISMVRPLCPTRDMT